MTKPRSSTLPGLIALVILCAPLALAPVRMDQSLHFVREYENREPSRLPAEFSASALIDEGWWTQLSRTIEDRVPFRRQLIEFKGSLLPTGLGVGLSEKVGPGADGWLFWREALLDDLGSIADTRRALVSLDRVLGHDSHHARLRVIVAPDKATIYPDKLTDGIRGEYQQSLAQRALVHEFFADPARTRCLDLWTPMRAIIAGSPDPIYEPGGTHHNSAGAMVLARAVIDSIAPALWDPSEIETLWTRTVTPELAIRGGDWGRTESHTRLMVRRAGVRLAGLWHNETPIDQPQLETIETLPAHSRRRAVCESTGGALIGGRTLLIHDSCIGMYLQPTLIQFFEDVTLMHADDVTTDLLRGALGTYDTVIYQSVERYFARRINTCFEGL